MESIKIISEGKEDADKIDRMRKEGRGSLGAQ
jgi:hypothetical protein